MRPFATLADRVVVSPFPSIVKPFLNCSIRPEGVFMVGIPQLCTTEFAPTVARTLYSFVLLVRGGQLGLVGVTRSYECVTRCGCA